jgi:hypothetical protein
MRQGMMGREYGNYVLAVTGGRPPHIWSLASGSLPPGLSLSRTGTISGTLTSAGTFNFTVRVRDSSSPAQIASRALSITVNPTIAWGNIVSPEFKTKVIEISNRLGVNASYLMAVMAFETGGSFSPSVRNQIGATGLIQFLPSTARNLGTTTDALANMTAVEQLDYVEKHLRQYQGRLRTLADVYMAILWPRAIGEGDNFILFEYPSPAYRLNSGLDQDRNRQVTKGEASARVQAWLTKGLLRGNKG